MINLKGEKLFGRCILRVFVFKKNQKKKRYKGQKRNIIKHFCDMRNL